jgi:hypothetical protein
MLRPPQKPDAPEGEELTIDANIAIFPASAIAWLRFAMTIL